MGQEGNAVELVVGEVLDLSEKKFYERKGKVTMCAVYRARALPSRMFVSIVNSDDVQQYKRVRVTKITKCRIGVKKVQGKMMNSLVAEVIVEPVGMDVKATLVPLPDYKRKTAAQQGLFRTRGKGMVKPEFGVKFNAEVRKDE